MSGTASVTFGDVARLKVQALARELGFDGPLAKLLEVLDIVGDGWIERPVGIAPPFSTDITDDGSPFELSVAIENNQVELRVLAEAQEPPYDLGSNWRAGIRATERLAARFGLDLARFRSVSELFVPDEHALGPFAMWHAAAVGVEGAPLIKIYLNPQARGASQQRVNVAVALDRLGINGAWDMLERKLRLAVGAELAFFSLDLAQGPEARVKIYIAYPDAYATDLEAALAGTAGYVRDDAREFVRAVTGIEGPFRERPILVCHAFSPRSPVPTSTLHVPVRCYTSHDQEAAQRCGEQLSPPQAGRFLRALEAMAGRSLDASRGFITYVSLRRRVEARRLTCYLAPQLYFDQAAARASSAPAHSCVAPRGRSQAGQLTQPTMLAVQDAIHRARLRLREHSFIQLLQAGPSLPQLRAMAHGLTFFVMAFQDVLRIARTSISEPTLRAIAETHEREDRGHDQWFLHDARKLGSVCDLQTVFSSEHDPVRDVSYGLVSEILSAQHDTQRLAVVLCLEAAGAEFFHRTISVLERLGEDDGLRYFARSHQAVEEGHEVFEENAQDRLLSIELAPSVLGEVLRTVEKSFVRITLLADELERRMRHAEPKRSVA